MFIAQMVIPAFEELQAALEQYGREILLSTNHTGRAAASIRVRNAGRDEFEYIIAVRVTPERAFPYVEVVPHPGWPRRASEGMIREGRPRLQRDRHHQGGSHPALPVELRGLPHTVMPHCHQPLPIPRRISLPATEYVRCHLR